MGLQPGELLIDDSNCEVPVGRSRGHYPRDYDRIAFGALPGATPFPLKVIPRNEWSARIKEREEQKALLSQLMLDKGIPSLDQNGTNYCWTNGVVTAMLAIRAYNNLEYVPLSPASVAAPIKGYKNVGGWGGEALEYITENGICPVSLWPANAISRSYDNAESREARKQFLIREWWELRPRNFDEKMTLLLLGIPVPSGYNWWRHETCGIDPVEIESGRYGSRERNSWGDSYGQKGFFVLSESKATPDDAVAPALVSRVA